MTEQKANTDNLRWAHNWVWCVHEERPHQTNYLCEAEHHPVLVDTTRSSPDHTLTKPLEL